CARWNHGSFDFW
nr:immunoglobulin heavy chain junction region [Macaca mulatta]MOW23188.1 immunoglobulin heavy chain junction region [Macaca mulatta]MOW23192.1 immunoglobulin heavy chain junction region [Macaca mulatta]MOW23202.1 immunoglobulin heavy chain junction region [Macaca mulatta]MOW23283.1 immunoglobulin heavy chain junction region [Macaca mulatta]